MLNLNEEQEKYIKILSTILIIVFVTKIVFTVIEINRIENNTERTLIELERIKENMFKGYIKR